MPATPPVRSQYQDAVRHSERLLVKPKAACAMLDCGNTRLYQLLKAGELKSFLDGRSRKITVDSIRTYIARQLRDANPVSSQTPRPRGRPRKNEAAAACA